MDQAQINEMIGLMSDAETVAAAQLGVCAATGDENLAAVSEIYHVLRSLRFKHGHLLREEEAAHG